jgi:transcriptional regulator with XRE-family HTH domain
VAERITQPLAPQQVAGLLLEKVREAGLTLAQASRRIGRSDDYLSRLLRRRHRNIDVGTLYAVLEALDLPPAAFFGELKRRAPGGPGAVERDPDELLLGTVTRGDLFAEIRRVVSQELAARGEAGSGEPLDAGPPGGEEEPDPGPRGDEGS